MAGRDGLVDEVKLSAERASQMYHRLLVIVTKDDIGVGRYIGEGLEVRRINVGEKLGEELLEIPASRRPLKVAGLLAALLDDVVDDRVLLDNIEILFEDSLKVEPLALLRSVSRRRLVMVIWRGEIETGNLVYGVPGHPEYRNYPARDVALVRFT